MEELQKFGAENLGKYADMAVELVMKHGPRLVLAIFTLMIGLCGSSGSLANWPIG